MELPDYVNEEYIEGVYSGDISVFALPLAVYAYTAREMDKYFFYGFGSVDDTQVLREKAVKYRQNLARFSGAKTFQNTLDLTASVFNSDGGRRRFSEFKSIALEINDKYNTRWLNTEQQNVVATAQMSRKWGKFESQKDIFPLLQYRTVRDGRVRPSHKSLHGLTAKVGDPVWRRIYPPNSWGCRCNVIQLTEDEGTVSQAEIKRKTSLIDDEFSRDNAFNFHPWYDEVMFKDFGRNKASYFNVPKEFKTGLSDNFGFPSMEEITGKSI